MSRLLYRLGRGAALHPWRTLGLWVLAAALVFGLAPVAGGKTHDDWDVPGTRSQAGIELLREHVPGAGNASANVVVHGDDQFLARPHEGGGVLWHLEGEFVTLAGGIAATPEMGEAAYADARALTTALEPWSNGRQYLNFAEDAVDPRAAYRESAWTAGRDPVRGRPRGDVRGQPPRAAALSEDRSSPAKAGDERPQRAPPRACSQGDSSSSDEGAGVGRSS